MSDIEVSHFGCDISEEPAPFILNHEERVSRLFENVRTHLPNCVVLRFRKKNMILIFIAMSIHRNIAKVDEAK